MARSLDLCSTIQLEECSHRSSIPNDCISSLSDDILLFILSFIPYKEVVRTSLLSRRWLNLWMHSLLLDFHGPALGSNIIVNDRERRKHIMLVDRVLQQHMGRYLKEFKIVWQLDRCSQKDIDRWLAFALGKKVECLELNLLIHGLYPDDLDYSYVFAGPFLNFGSGKNHLAWSGLKCLKSLSLKNVDVSCEAINFVLLNCPFLERLEVVGSSTLVDLVISDPSLVLKYLTIMYCYDLKLLSISNFNLVSLNLYGISAVGVLTLTHLPMLVEFVFNGNSHVLKHFISQASSGLAHLEAFTLEGIDLKDAVQLFNYDQLTKLKRLTLTVVARCDDVPNAISIVNACPCLEEFVFTLFWPEHGRRFAPNRKVARCATPPKSKSLKVFEFVGYQGNATDVELIRLVVESAFNLEKIIIDSIGELVYDHSKDTTIWDQNVRVVGLEHFDFLTEFPPHIHFVYPIPN